MTNKGNIEYTSYVYVSIFMRRKLENGLTVPFRMKAQKGILTDK